MMVHEMVLLLMVMLLLLLHMAMLVSVPRMSLRRLHRIHFYTLAASFVLYHATKTPEAKRIAHPGRKKWKTVTILRG